MRDYSSNFSRRNFLASAGALGMGLAAQKPPGMKIFVLWDMEGSSGIFTREQAWYCEQGVREEIAGEARNLFTADVNSATAAALSAGVSDLIVCDTHHGGGNLVRDKLLKDSRINYQYFSKGTEDGKTRWMPGLDRHVAGLMLPGHHAKAFTDA